MIPCGQLAEVPVTALDERGDHKPPMMFVDTLK